MLFASTVAIATHALLARAALSPQQIQSVFVGQELSTLTGGYADMSPAFNFTVVGNKTHALVALTVSDSEYGPASDLGWIGVGRGTTMIGSDDFVLWPTKNGTWTISRRMPTKATQNGGTDPGDAGGSPDDFAILDNMSTGAKVKGVAQVAFLKTLDASYTPATKVSNWTLAKGEEIVYARCSTNPGSASPKAKIEYHDLGQGTASVDLSKPISATAKSFGAGPVIASLVMPSAVQAVASTSATMSSVPVASAMNSTMPMSSDGHLLSAGWLATVLSIACVLFGLVS